ncbi:PREDICTED: poly(ADP-ribose) glycohydrolase ARH3-like isoform X4 [Trachymyrmex cornetzi]|uniref:poly(ADP-ribose) glycohydrolase ARH3-like isoform X4 n=1 Tax=Trachymyrmex cornetzi TaxID=471704 RepID=UPI00084F1DCF|nr:PREDICTED: poly(ADP-ribose) glycohydrolase ARH3-like isoform X4 [Trachymyrmex cornetzi]
MNPVLLKNKFRGTMLGVLVGDCLGSPYEGLKTISAQKKSDLQRRLNQLWDTKFREPVMEYTDDSAMTRALAESLIEKQELDVVDVAKRFAKSYHERPDRGYGAGTVTAIAIQQSLHLNPSEELNISNFVDDLINKMDKIEGDTSELYKERLNIVKNLLSEDGDNLDTIVSPNEQRVAEELGVNVRALESVPTAIFCFLKAQRRIKKIRTDNPLRRVIQYAISLGGDTDTIASMAGAIAGAFYGYEKFSLLLLSHCEEWERFQEMADKLLDIATSNEINK